jgi:cytochrome c peroxidase
MLGLSTPLASTETIGWHPNAQDRVLMTWTIPLVVALLVTFAAAKASEIDTAALARAHHPPLGLPAVPVPADNPLTAEKIALGRKLFFDRRLSANGTISCAMCHVPEQGYTVNELATPVGIEGRSVRRNAPTVVNAAYQHTLFHDGRVPSLEEQALLPLVDRDEMGNLSHDAVIARLRGLSDYAGLFERAFGRPADAPALAQAIAAWQRTLISGDSPFDRWYFGKNEDALPEAAKRGFRLFTDRAGCGGCHAIAGDHALFTDHGFHNTGVGAALPTAGDRRVEIAPGVFATVTRQALEAVSEPSKPDFGRFEVTKNPADRWAYKTPSLRNVALTAPYMHDGSLATLADVVRFYNDGGRANDGLDPRIRPLGLSEADVADLVAFLESLTGANIADLIRDGRSVVVGNP